MRAAQTKDVQEPLMLVMPVKAGATAALRMALQQLAQEDRAKRLEDTLDRVGTVHSTRFVILEDGDSAKLIVVAVFDGTMEDYIAAFARELDEQFNLLFRFIEDTPDKPREPVRDHVEPFQQYVANRNVPPANGRTYSAYPGLTALDIYEATRPREDGAPAL